MLWIVYQYYFEMDHDGLNANAVSWLILSLPSNSKKGVDNLLESKPTKINDNINNNFVLSYRHEHQIHLLILIASLFIILH